MGKIFRDRTEAGQCLARELKRYANLPDIIVLGLPRGGVPVAFEVAAALHAPLDVFIVRKLGTPGQQELAMGAIASGGVRVINEDVVRGHDISMEVIDAVAEAEDRELKRRELAYRGCQSEPDVTGRTVILIDDGVATGATLRAAIRAIRSQHPARLIVGVPTAARSTYMELRTEVDALVALMTPEPFFGVGEWYSDFTQTSDAEVAELLERSRETFAAAGRW
jgi:predicted phosphoribosyltransferase